ncbi:MAG: Sec-independent protein translocase protein TatB [Rhizobiaceae bacterium]|nr:Sec-independent protein translocase protein TatB [Rhizobiaceae bacterium]
MFDIGWTEMLVIAIVMIVVVGPKDLPKMLRTFGKTTSKLRVMAGDFRKQFDEALKEAELDDVKGLVDDVRKLNPTNEIRQALNPMQKAAADVRAGLDSALNPQKPLAPSTPATAALKPMEDPAAAKAAEPAKPMENPAPAAGQPVAEAAKPEPIPATPLSRPELAAPPSDFFPAAVDDTPAPVARAAKPLKNGATHAPVARTTPKAAAAKAAPKPAGTAKSKPAAKAATAAAPKKPATRSKPT